MKTRILLCLAMLMAFSCKKKDNSSTGSGGSNSGGSGGGTIDTYEVRIESNYLRSYMTVENMTDQSLIKRYNTLNDSAKNCPITYVFTGYSSKKYRVYSTSVKNATDTTLYMTGSGLTWNYVRVKKNGFVIFEHKDTVGIGSGYGSHRITSNECTINY